MILKKIILLSLFGLLTFLLPAQTNSQTVGFLLGLTSPEPTNDLNSLLENYPELERIKGNPFWTKQNIALLAFNDKMSPKDITSLKTSLEDLTIIDFVNELFEIEGNLNGLFPEFYVKLKKEADLVQLKRIAQQTNTSIQGPYHYMPNVYILKADKTSLGNAKEMSDYFEASQHFEYTSFNSLFSLDVHSNDPLYEYQWSHENTGSALQYNGTEDADMDIPEAWDITMGDPNIKIAIFDSGIDTLHPELIDNLLPGFDAMEGITNGHPSLELNDNAHGTACAGIINAKANNEIGMAGVAPNCKIISVRMFTYISFGGGTPITNTQALLDAVNWSSQTANADIVSSSTGLKNAQLELLVLDTAMVNDAINQAALTTRNGKGWITLFSAGNDNGTELTWPSRLSNTISVGASDMCDQRKTPGDCSGENWWGSDYGPGLAVMAPGVKVATTDMLPPYGYVTNDSFTLTFNGTSAACPNAAGVMALILSVNNDLTRTQATHILQASCDKVGGYDYNMDMPSGTWTNQMGYGRVNAYSALLMAQNFTPIEEQSNLNTPFSIYPNPGNSNTIFEYELPHAQKIKLVLYDQLGKVVITLVNSHQNQGIHRIPLPEQIPSGIYFASLYLDQNVISKKLIIAP